MAVLARVEVNDSYENGKSTIFFFPGVLVVIPPKVSAQMAGNVFSQAGGALGGAVFGGLGGALQGSVDLVADRSSEKRLAGLPEDLTPSQLIEAFPGTYVILASEVVGFEVKPTATRKVWTYRFKLRTRTRRYGFSVIVASQEGGSQIEQYFRQTLTSPCEDTQVQSMLPVSDNLALALASIFLFLPFGLAAVYRAVQIRKCQRLGDRVSAHNALVDSRKWVKRALGMFLVILAGCAILGVLSKLSP